MARRHLDAVAEEPSRPVGDTRRPGQQIAFSTFSHARASKRMASVGDPSLASRAPLCAIDPSVANSARQHDRELSPAAAPYGRHPPSGARRQDRLGRSSATPPSRSTITQMQCDRFADLMGDEHRRKAVLSSDAGQKIVHFEPGQSVESAERLVEQQQVRTADQRPRQRHPSRGRRGRAPTSADQPGGPIGRQSRAPRARGPHR